MSISHIVTVLLDKHVGGPSIGASIGGVILCLVAATVTNFGLTLQKYSHIKNSEKDAELQRGMCTQPFWIFGFILFIVGQIMSLVALGFTSQSVVATLGSFSLVTNVLFAPCFLGEKPTKMDALSVLIIMIGSGVVVYATSNHPSHEDYQLADLIRLYQGTAFLIYMGITLTIILTSLVILHRPFMVKHPKPLIPSKNAGMLAAFVGAAVASLSVLFAKCSVHLVKSTFAGSPPENQFTQPLTYLIISCLILCATQSVRYLNIGLQEGEALKIIPFYFVSSTVLTIAGGLIYFNDLAGMAPKFIAAFAVGVLVTIGGVYVASIKMSTDEARESILESERASIAKLASGDSQEKNSSSSDVATSLPNVTVTVSGDTERSPLLGQPRTKRGLSTYSYAPQAYRASFQGGRKSRRYSSAIFGGLGVA